MCFKFERIRFILQANQAKPPVSTSLPGNMPPKAKRKLPSPPLCAPHQRIFALQLQKLAGVMYRENSQI